MTMIPTYVTKVPNGTEEVITPNFLWHLLTSGRTRSVPIIGVSNSYYLVI